VNIDLISAVGDILEWKKASDRKNILAIFISNSGQKIDKHY
jgi:hypothetical protein